MGRFAVAATLSALGGVAAAPSLAVEASQTAIGAAAKGCCEICRKGKACVGSCIARDKKCHKVPSCACDG